MQRVITINLNGAAYQLDESAYDRLRAYLDDAARTLADNPDKAEILSDFERAIGEKCQRHLSPQKTVVTAAEIDAILAEMGPVDASLGAGTAEGSVPPASAGQPDRDRPRKRLHRLRRPGGVAGVCAGVAAFIGVKTSWVRLGFLMFIGLTHGFGLILYVVLALVIPEAHSSDEWAAAHGDRFDARSVVEEARRQAAEIKKDLSASGADWRRGWQRERRRWRAQERAWRQEWRAQTEPAGPSVPAANWSWFSVGGQPSPTLAGFALVIFAGLSIASVIVLVAAIASILNNGSVYGWPLPPGVPVWAALLMAIVLFQLVNAPLRQARYASYHAWGRPSTFALWDGVVPLALAVVVLVMLYQRMPPPVEDFGDFMRHLPDAFRMLVQDAARWAQSVIQSLG